MKNRRDHFPEQHESASLKANVHICSEQFISIWGGSPVNIIPWKEDNFEDMEGCLIQ